MPQHYRLQFPPEHERDLAQDEVYFYLIEDGKPQKLRFHDYGSIFDRPGLYEQLFYDRLKCTSPQKVCALLEQSVRSEMQVCSELRVLDLGAGNGMMAEQLRKLGAARVVGVDIIKEARLAAYRDRPTAYDDYKVADFTALTDDDREELSDWNFDCLVSVAALGFGDIPPAAFFQALQFVPKGGWVAFNIKETFLNNSDQTGFSRFIRELIFSEYLDIYHLELYRHRLSMEGMPLKYYALVARMTETIPAEFLANVGVGEALS